MEEYPWYYNDGHPVPDSSGDDQGNNINPGQVQQDISHPFNNAASYNSHASQVSGNQMNMDHNGLGYNIGHSNYVQGANQSGGPMDYRDDEMSLQFDDYGLDDYNIDFGPPNDVFVVRQPEDNVQQQINSNPMGLQNPSVDINNFNAPSGVIQQGAIPQSAIHQTADQPKPKASIGTSAQAAVAHSPGKHAYAHAGKTINEMVNEETGDQYQGYFTSRQHRKQLEAEYYKQQATELAADIDPESLEDLPEDEDKLREWHVKIVEAIKDFSNVVNKDRVLGKWKPT